MEACGGVHAADDGDCGGQRECEDHDEMLLGGDVEMGKKLGHQHFCM